MPAKRAGWLTNSKAASDFFEHALEIFPDFPVLEAQDPDPRSVQELAASRIAVLGGFMIVRSTVELHGEFLRRAVEVQYVDADAVLAPKLASLELSALEMTP